MDGRIDVAIVGLGALFPGAPDATTFWRNIVGGVDAIGTVPESRWDPELYYDPVNPGADRFYCRRGGFLDDLATFDSSRFGIMPSTVDVAEPDQLLALRVAAEAIADAGGEQALPSRARVGVVVGRGGYLTPGCARLDQRVATSQLVAIMRDLVPGVDAGSLRAALVERLGPEQPEASIGLVPNLAASRIANRFDLHGPAYTVDAACASGLVAVEHAVRELAAGRCDAMLAGAVHVTHHPTLWSVFTQLKALSRAGRIRPFDASADGTLLSEGVGMVLLKRLSDAQDDRVYAVIRGVGTASDGRATSMMTPNPEGQLLAVQRAWYDAGLEPGDGLGLIEAHGTATPAGDTAELRTMTAAFGTGDAVGIGTVKSMIGHAMPAAGMAGLIKAALALHHRTLPPTLHISSPHSALQGSRFDPIHSARSWDTAPRAVVNAFGFGGINAHAVLEPVAFSGPDVPPPVEPVLTLSGDTPADIERDLLAADSELMARSGVPAEDRPCRLTVWAPDARKLKMARQVVARGRRWTGRHGIWFALNPLLNRNDQVAFLFPGFERTGELTGEESVVDHAVQLLKAGRHQANRLRAAGIVPSALAGHSMGEWTAMVVAGIYPTIDSFVESLSPGMVAVADVVYAALGCSAAVAQEAVTGDVVVSHDNCPHQSVICGPADQLAQVVDRLKANGVLAQVMPFRTGFHTPALAPYLAAARSTVDALPVHPPSVPVWSATSLAPMPSAPGEIRDLVLRHLVEPVRFQPMIRRLHQQGIRAFVQVGTGSLASFVEDTLGDEDHLTVVGDSAERAAAALWAFGLNRGGRGKRLSLGLPRIRLEPMVLDQTVVTDSPLGAALNSVLAETSAMAREVVEALNGSVVADTPKPVVPRPEIKKPDKAEFTRVFSLDTMPELVDHCIFPQPDGWPVLSDGFPTVPITGLLEVIEDAARTVAPDGVVTAIEHVRAMQWLAVEPATETTITVHRTGDGVRVQVGNYTDGNVVIESAYPKPEERTRPSLENPRPAPVPADRLYVDGWMFHGPRYAGVTDIDTLADNGISGTLTVLPAPGALLDNAGQLIGHWMQVSRDVDQTVLPTGIDRVQYYGPAPTGEVHCTAWITSVTGDQMRADAELRLPDGTLWCRIDGWTTRRFTTDDRIWQVKLRPEHNTLGEPQPGGWVLVTEKWADSATRELMMRRYLTASERDEYRDLDLRAQRQWLVKRVAVKDAVRRWLWNRGAGPIFPAELTVTESGAGVRVRGAFTAPEVSVAHCVDPERPSGGGCAVAIAGESGVDIRVRPVGTSYVVDLDRSA
jgi:3-oxoacyl-(acyl-carrier-protein) synthase